MANEFRIKNGLIVSGSADFEQDLRVRGTLTVDELHTSITTASIIYESGSTAFGNSIDDIHTLTGSVNITGSISLNGQAIGTGKLDETTFNTFTASHNTTNTEFGNLTSSYNSFTSSYDTNSGSFNTRVSNLESFSSSLDVSFVNEIEFGSFSSSVKTFQSNLNTYTGSLENRLYGIEGTTGSLNTFTASVNGLIESATSSLSSSIATTNLGQNNRLDSLELKTGSYATTGSNTFKGLQLVSGSILPTDDNAYDLGSPTYQWRDVYISSGSLYVDGSKVLSSTAQELTITTDNGQSIKILESTTDSIVLQTADGNIELKSSAAGDILIDPTNGKILLKGTIEVLSGQKIQSSVGGTPVVFADDVVVSGSVVLTGTIDGVDLSVFETNTNNRLNSLETSTGSLNTFTSSTAGRLTSIETSTSSLNSFSTSTNTRLNSLESTTASINTFTSSINTTINNIINNGTLVSGSSQIMITGTTGYSAFSSSIDTSITNLSSSVAVTTNNLSSSIATTDLGQNNRLNSLETKTGSYATTGSNSFIGTQNITGSVIISQDLTVLGSSSFLYVTSSQLAVSNSYISVNVFEPAERFGGLKVYDSGSISHQATASLLWDSQNNHWIYQNASGSNYSGGMLLAGPRNTGSLGEEVGLTSGKIAKSVGGDHLDNSIITETGGGIGISGSLVVTGSLSASGTVYGTNITAIETSTSSLNSYTSSTNTILDVIEGTTSSLNTYTSSNNTRLGNIETATSSLNSFTNSINTTIKSKLNSDGVISGSSQISYGSISGVPSGIVSGSSQISYGSISGIPSGIVSGSSQISFGSISGVPGGLVSGSSQVDLTATTNYASGIKTRLDAVGVLSGSAQVSFGSISGVPSGLVSGSSQITLSSTTGFGSYLNQAVLTSSSPTFAGITTSGLTLLGGQIYVSPTNANTLNSGYANADNTSDIWINYRGYNDGQSYYRNFNIGDGRGENILWAQGSSRRVSINNGQAASYTLHVNGDGYFSSTLNTNVIKGDSGSNYPHSFTNTDAGNTHWTNRGSRLLTSNGTNWAGDGKDPVMAIVGNSSATTRGNVIGLTLHNDDSTDNSFSPMLTFSSKSNSGSYNTTYASISGRKTGYVTGVDTNWAKGELHFFAHGDSYINDTPTLRLTNTSATFDTSLTVNNSSVIYFNSSNAYALRLDSSSSSVENDLRFAKGGTDYGAIQTNGTDHGFEFYVHTGSDWSRMFYMKRDATESVFATGTVRPGANGTQNLGTSSYRWSTIYTSDLSLSNGIGDYTIVEGEEKLYLYNNKNNKVYSFVLQEEDPTTATPKKS